MRRFEVAQERPAARAEDQPRPALGLRPWLALLRRARSLRRFALAIRPLRVTAPRRKLPIRLVAECPGWFRSPVIVARTVMGRRRGVRQTPPGQGALIAGSAVHTIGVREPITVIALDTTGAILGVRRLKPRSVWRLRQAAWMLEISESVSSQVVGKRVRLMTDAGAGLAWPHDHLPIEAVSSPDA